MKLQKDTAAHGATRQCNDTLRKFLKEIQPRDELGDLLSHMNEHLHDLKSNLLVMTKFCKKLLHDFKYVNNNFLQRAKRNRSAPLNGKLAHRHISKTIKAKQPAPMTCLRWQSEGPDGQEKGTVTTNPKDIFLILHQAWEQIMHGRPDSLQEVADAFVSKYRKYIFKSPEFKLRDLSVEDFKAVCRDTSDSAAGLDGWAEQDIALMSDYAIQLIVDLLNAIEHGAEWPQHMLVTRAVFLSKDPDDISNPLAYRILKITSGWYRKWGSVRNRDIAPWIDKWNTEEINSIGRGAQNAWFNTSLLNELNGVSGYDTSGGSIDVFKCFDQVNRPLVHRLATEAGMPSRVLDAYFRYIDNLKIRFQVGKAIGDEHEDRCSIPQGCPFSMTIIGLVMVPWVNRMKEMKVHPRVLADDLMFSTHGTGHLERTIEATQASRSFFHDLGAKVADKKCFMFATDPHTRKRLADYMWDPYGLKIPNINDFRGLGTHFNLTKGLKGATLTERMRNATAMCRRLRWVKIPKERKEKIVRTNILPAGLYGAEACYVNKTVLQELRVAIAKVIGPASHRRCVDLTYVFCGTAKDLDPEVHITFNRIAALRRSAATVGSQRIGLFKLILKKYQKLAHSSRAPSDQPFLDWKTELAGKDDLDDMKPFRPQGPVGFLIEDLTRAGIKFDDSLRLHEEGEVPIDIWEMPWQHLKRAVFDLLTRARDKRVDNHRTFAGKFNELDYDISKKINHSLGYKEKRVYMHVATGGFWGEDHMQEAFDTDGKCPHCGEQNVSTKHILWQCPNINQNRSFKELCDLPSECLPEAIANGLPLAMAATSKQAFWGECDHEGMDDTSKGLIGVPFNRNGHRKADNMDSLINLQPASKGMEAIGSKSARAVFNQLRSSDGECITPVPFKCLANAPDKINVFTDGSWVNPKKWFLGFGGAGVHWPGRAICKQDLNDELSYYKPLNEGEQMLAFHTQHKNGLSLCTKVEAYNGNSTRAEITAGLVALMAEGPIHIGSDSRAFVDRANVILKRIHQHKRFKRPWGVISDGDLWAHFAKAVKAKGTRGIQITWVKGHANEAHIEAGVTDLFKKQGNDEADNCADRGTSIFGQDLIKTASFVNTRHCFYSSLMVKIVKHIVEAYIIHRKLIDFQNGEAQACEQAEARAKPYAPLGYVLNHKARSLIATSSVQCYKKLNSENGIRHIEAFLSSLQVNQDGDDKGRMITWLELYILYRLRGGVKPIPDECRKAVSRSTADKQMRAFRRKLKAVVERTLAPDGDAKLFKPTKGKPDNLKGCGILGRMPTLSFNVYMNEDEQRAVALALSKLIRTASLKKHNDFLNGHVNLIMNPLKLKGKAGWDSSLPTLSNCCLEDTQWAHTFKEGSIKPELSAMFYHCPKCDKVESSQRGVFQRVDLDFKHRCGFCCKSTAVKSWTCQCGSQWHTCPEHRGGYLLMPEGEPITAKLINGLPSTFTIPSCVPTSKKRAFKPTGGIAAKPKRCRKAEARGAKRANTVLLTEAQRLVKRPACLGPVFGGMKGGASASSSA